MLAVHHVDSSDKNCCENVSTFRFDWVFQSSSGENMQKIQTGKYYKYVWVGLEGGAFCWNGQTKASIPRVMVGCCSKLAKIMALSTIWLVISWLG